ncbi:OmpA family protein [Mangrovivirga cuniculi]|uniref:OmpA-like domain-containing protein n=1 Tax=Mangrovivirga cuniculi TaxID=2715131 RepID=A0A4D7JGK1_9BACT|nr:OmpA family protein [Mangrovivirga cuniculi]QCK14721.1 hypothetical protein DCC35_08190 [Mangrovivirga cuniculi]
MKIYYFLIFIMLSSCVVSKKRHDEALVENSRLFAENAALKDYKKALIKKNEYLESRNDSLRSKLKQTKTELTSSLSDKERQLVDKENKLDSAIKVNEKLSSDLNNRIAKIQELETLIEEKNAAVEKIKNIVSKALLNFKENDLTVSIKEGKVYVSLSEQLLFKSGSKEIDPKGKKALNQLAEAINTQEDINIMVEGHTDNVPISAQSKYMNDNWDLSVMRATEVVRTLINNGIDPKIVIASGRGEYHPVSSNENSEGRSKNRRTEIILTPNLDELYQIL